MSIPAPERDRARMVGALATVFVVALALRMWGIDFGLPLVVHMDEWEQTTASALLDRSGEISGPRAWRYPPLLAELISIGESLGFCGQEPCNTAARVPLGRYISALISALGALACTLACATLGMRTRAALFAGLLFAVLPLAVRLGRYATPDALATAMVAGALWAACRVARRGTLHDFLFTSVFVGLAAAAKYNAGIVAGAHLFGAFVWARVHRRPAASSLPRFAAATVASVLVFALALVWPWSNWVDFSGGLELEWRHYVHGHDGFDCANAAGEALLYLAKFGFGPAPSAAALAFAAWAVFRVDEPKPEDSPNDSQAMAALWIGGCAVLIYALLLLRQEVFFARLTAPLLPGLCLMLAALMNRAAGAHGPLRRTAVFTVLGACILALPLAWSARQAQTLSRPDTRLQANRWLKDEFMSRPDRYRVAIIPQSARRGLTKKLHMRSVPPEQSVARLRRLRFTHVIYGQGGVDRYRWRPEAYADKLAPFLAFHQELEDEATLVLRWSAPDLPGNEYFGEAGALIHNYTLELWEL